MPEWIDCSEEGRVPLRLDPGLLFGTGAHATTRMCLAALEKYAGEGKRALDLGCGSGILGIGAIVLGSDFCTACDIDPKAPDTVMENAALNDIGGDKMKVYAGDIIGDGKLRALLGTGYDIVLANIVSDVIIPLAPFVRAFMAPGGVFITSGIIDGREEEVAAALKSAGLEMIAHHHEEEWHCFELLLVLVLRRRRRLGQSLVERGHALPHAFKIIKFHSSHRCIICRHLKKRQRCEIISAQNIL